MLLDDILFWEHRLTLKYPSFGRASPGKLNATDDAPSLAALALVKATLFCTLVAIVDDCGLEERGMRRLKTL